MNWLKKYFSRLHASAIVGIVASAADWISLVILVHFFAVKPQIANFPTLIIGSGIQFYGNRRYVFKSFRGMKRQLLEFMLAEFCSFLMNGFIFHALVTWTTISYAIARPLGSFAVFTLFSYPLWKFVFRKQRQKV